MIYASWGRRVAAALIDSGIGLSPLALGFTIYLIEPSLEAVAMIPALLIYFPLLAWIFVVAPSKHGQSPGKQVMGIRLIVEETGQPLSKALLFVRYFVLHQVDQFLYIGYLWPLFDAKRQTLVGDKVLGTVVVRTPG